MGDPKKPKKKYETPRHPWIKEDIEIEKKILNEYGLKNKREVWKNKSKLRKFKELSKKYTGIDTNKAKEDTNDFLDKLKREGILKQNQGIDEVLGLELKDILDRRLQTLVYKKKLASSMKQARQFIVHNHINVNGKKVNIPGYLVQKDEEDTIGFNLKSNLHSDENLERINIANKKVKKIKNDQKK
ncbi:MAG: 30S ribosomal protein S4 [Candidatus Woesearchaeota archaeon]